MLKRLLLAAINMLILGFTYSDSHLKNIVSPKVDFSNNQIGSLSITFHWQAFFTPNTILTNLKAKITMPFALSSPMSIEWIQINDACIVSTNTQTTTTYASVLPTDSSADHFFDMIDANYYPGAKYKMIVRIDTTADIPTTLGNTNPIVFKLVSTDKANPIVYSYNRHFGYFRITSAALGDFEFELTPSYTDANLKEFTRDFNGKADIRIVDKNISRILLKMNNYVFSDDAESTCATEPDDTLGISLLDRNNFFCEFEDSRKKGLYFIWKDNVYPPIDQTFRIKFRVKNPDVPGSTDVTIAMLDRYSPKILKYKSISNAYSCGPTKFGTLYPKLYLGPNLDVSSSFFPNLTLFTKGDKLNSITFNSIRLEFKTSLDLPKPSISYKVRVTIGGVAGTSVPLSLIYHDLPIAQGYNNVKVSVNAANGDISFDNVGELSSRSTYTIGFKVGFIGTESLIFLGDQSFGAIEILDSTATTVFVYRKAPPNLRSSFKVSPKINQIPASFDYITYMHSHSSTANPGWLNNNNLLGMKTAAGNTFLIFSFDRIATYVTASTANQNYLEIITSQYVSASQTGTATTDCRRGSTGGTTTTVVDVTATFVASCDYALKNKGLSGSEYSRFRMGGLTAAFFSNTYFTYVWSGASVSRMSSIVKDGTEAAIMDTYINAYSDTYTSDVTADFARGLAFQTMINGFVFTNAQFTQTAVHVVNYNRAAGFTLDGLKVPTFLRISGKLNGINTFKTKKLVLFFEEIVPLALDLTDKYEIGCNTAFNADVKCYYYKGFDSATCAAVGCKSFMAYSRIEVLMSSSISSISDIYDLHVLVPVYLPPGTATTFRMVLGVAAQMEGSLSAYPDMLSVNPFLTTVTACNSGCTTQINDFSSVLTNSIATPKIVLLNIASAPIQGTTTSSQFDFNCNTAECTITNIAKDYFSFTYCAEFNFMSDSRFTVNSGIEVYEQCVKNIKYQVDDAGTTRTKYCLFCPQFNSGTASSAVTFDYYQVPSGLGLKMPLRTYTGLGGRQTTNAAIGTVYGLRSLANHNLLTPNAVSTSTITGFSISPSTIYYDSAVSNVPENSVRLVFSMTLANPVPINGRIIIDSAEDFPFTFLSAGTSTYCKFLVQNVGCTITISSTLSFVIRPTFEVPAGLLQIAVWGINTKLITAATLPKSHSINARTTNAASATDFIGISSPAATLTIQQYQENSVSLSPNVLKVNNLVLKENTVSYRTELTLDVYLGNLKYFYTSDELKINLSDGGYITNTVGNEQPAYCEVLDPTTKAILPEFETCSVLDLNNIKITVSTNTLYNNFTVRILNYFVTALSPAAIIPTSQVYFQPTPATVFQTQAVGDTEPAWPTTLSAATLLPSLTLTKKISYFGFRSDYTLQMTTSAVDLKYETRIYVQFPAPYAAGLSSFPVSCYQDDPTAPIKLYCWRMRDRTLAITGFRNEITAGNSIVVYIYGVQQPLHSEKEQFLVSIDADDDTTNVNEIRSFTMASAPVTVPNTIPRLEILSSEYSHLFIRAINSFLFSMKSTITISVGNYIHVYIDYLEFEYDIASFTGVCTIKETKISSNMADSCVREGNRYKIKIGTQLSANVVYTVLIEDIPTPDFYSCKVKRPEIIVTDSSTNLLAMSTDIFQNTEIVTYVTDDQYTYFTFDGMTTDAPLTFKKGIFNEIGVKRLDGERFNDDFNFTLGFTENGIFSQLAMSEVKTYHSHFGLSQVPVYLASSLNTFTNEIPVTVNFTARFRNTIFAKLPILRALLSNTKSTLVLPSTITVWTSKGSLSFYVHLNEIPISDISFTVTFTGTAGLLSCSPSTFTLGQNQRLVQLKISSSHPAGSSVLVHTMVISPSGSTGYQATVVDINLIAEQTSTSSVGITLSQALVNGFSVDVVSPQPVSFYSITMPQKIYREFTKGYITTKYDQNNRTDQKYYIDHTLSEGVEVLGLVVNQFDLKAKETYITTFYITGLDGTSYTSSLTFTTQDSAGGFGYINLTFASSFPSDALPGLVCHMGQLFSYPLEK